MCIRVETKAMKIVHHSTKIDLSVSDDVRFLTVYHSMMHFLVQGYNLNAF